MKETVFDQFIGKTVMVYYCGTCGCFVRFTGILQKLGHTYTVQNGPIVCAQFWPEHATYNWSDECIEVTPVVRD